MLRAPNLRLPQTDRPYRWSVAGSIVIHAIVLGLFVAHEIDRRDAESRESRAPGVPGPRGGGGGAVFRIELPPYQAAEQPAAQPVEQPPIPPPIRPPPIKIEKLQTPVQTGTVTSSVDVSQLGAGQGSGTGGGRGTGLGQGVGADTGRGIGGEGGDVFPPTPRYTILPPLPQPASMRGRTLRVHFWVNAQGKVTRVQVDPEIKDASYRQQFLAMMREYTFNPAKRLDGTTVEGDLVMPITL